MHVDVLGAGKKRGDNEKYSRSYIPPEGKSSLKIRQTG